jgi:hypothetical protein
MPRNYADGDGSGLPGNQYWGKPCPAGHPPTAGRLPRYRSHGSCGETASGERRAAPGSLEEREVGRRLISRR